MQKKYFFIFFFIRTKCNTKMFNIVILINRPCNPYQSFIGDSTLCYNFIQQLFTWPQRLNSIFYLHQYIKKIQYILLQVKVML